MDLNIAFKEGNGVKNIVDVVAATAGQRFLPDQSSQPSNHRHGQIRRGRAELV